jgi:glycerophosphoryl diester phosphodiesterase
VSLELRRPAGRPWRIGHRAGAGLAGALAHGLDAVELDVVPGADGALVLAHDVPEADGAPATLEAGLALLAAEAPMLALELDLKLPGYETEVVEALRRHGLLERAFVSSVFEGSLRRVGELAPGLPRSLTYPYDRFGLGRRRALLPVAGGALLALRRALPYRIGGRLARAGASAATLHFAVCSRAAVARCHDLEAAVFAWTVDSRRLARRLARAGVDGIITNDSRIFDPPLI